MEENIEATPTEVPAVKKARKPFSAETRAKMSLARKGKKYTEEQKANNAAKRAAKKAATQPVSDNVEPKPEEVNAGE